MRSHNDGVYDDPPRQTRRGQETARCHVCGKPDVSLVEATASHGLKVMKEHWTDEGDLCIGSGQIPS